MTSTKMQNVEPFVDCSDVFEDKEQLRSHAAENGHLYFPGLLPVDDVPVRHEVLQIADRHNLLREDIDLNEGIRKEGVYIDLEYDKPTPPALHFNDLVSAYDKTEIGIYGVYTNAERVSARIEALKKPWIDKRSVTDGGDSRGTA